MHLTHFAWLSVPLLCALAAVAPGQEKIRPNEDVAQVVRGNDEFALQLYRQLARKEGNLFYSPYSVSTALAMTYAGARGQTAEQMKTALHFHLEPDRLHAGFAALGDHLNAGAAKRPFQLSVANRLWGQKDYGFLPAFTQLTQKYYHAGLEEVDFDQPEQARKTINGWVDKETRDKIKDLIPAGILNPLTRLVLTNAIYFKAPWLNPFNPKSTREGSFTRADGSKVKAALMAGGFRARYADVGDCGVLELPYEGRAQSMVLLLPAKNDGLPALEAQLSAHRLGQWLGKLRTHQVDVRLPRFKVTAEFLLNDALKKLGMTDAFDVRKANFSGLTTREQVYIRAVLHKAFVEVNEAGTEAAASTAVVIEARSLPPPATFHADHPFLYLIRDNATGSILFVGRLADPQSK